MSSARRVPFVLFTLLTLAACASDPGGEEQSESDLALQPNVRGSINGQVRTLSVPEVEAHRFQNDDGLRTWEGLVDHWGKPDATLHLVDQQRFPDGHFQYTTQALGQALTHDQFLADVSFPTRTYMPFQVYDFRDKPIVQNGKTFTWVMNIRRYRYRDTEKELADALVQLRTLLSEGFMKGFGEPALYVYESNIANTDVKRRPHASQVTELKNRGFEVIPETAIRRTCESSTLGNTVFAGTCVQRADRGQAWFRCGGGGAGDWQEISGPSAGCSVCPQLGGACPASAGVCRSATLGVDVPVGTCVQRQDSQAWFRCGGTHFEDWNGIGGPDDPGCSSCPQLGGACP